MGESDAERSIDKEWLRFEFAIAARRWIPDMADTHLALKAQEGLEMKDFADKTVSFFEMELVIKRNDSGCILPPMLEEDQAVIEIVNCIIGADNGEDPTDREILRIPGT